MLAITAENNITSLVVSMSGWSCCSTLTFMRWVLGGQFSIGVNLLHVLVLFQRLDQVRGGDGIRVDYPGEIDVYVIRGIGEAATLPPDRSAEPWDWKPYAWTTLIVAVCGGLAGVMRWIELAEANIVAVFLLGVVLAAIRFGRGAGIYASIASVLVFDFFLVPPYLTFAVSAMSAAAPETNRPLPDNHFHRVFHRQIWKSDSRATL
jgi:hypothetical protein